MDKEINYDLLFIDVKLSTISGLETYLAIREVNPKAVAIMMTAYREETSHLVAEAIANSPATCPYKPFALGQVLELAESIYKGIWLNKMWSKSDATGNQHFDRR